MSVTSVDKDFEQLTLTLIADFDAPAEQVWRLWEDPRKIERWWGPPTYPATFERHDFKQGGETAYYMTGPEGDKHYGWWKVTAIDPPRSVEITEGFADDEGRPIPEMPASIMRMRLSDHDGGTRMELRSTFDSREQMDQLVEMGMEEGLAGAVGQMDALLTA
ncbi:SRPBCC domain-containing protein [Glycomyces sp. L485]|uniref:SRPBCC family protein n=1 Tax=Glycomyces sp. L485 TaxID=2909235 RepID=UPI001F4B0F7A|nr:SRPBCC domain-containing protein [Glycomyces sp. L485]MCH7232805.1 SRPBCC domain-containing protein [Glycomyces sp. L485]